MKINKKIQDAQNDLISSNDVKNHEVKLRITTWIDSDILQALKTEAEQRKIGYQTILNQKLREIVFGEKDPLHERVDKLESLVSKLAKKQKIG